MGNPDKQMPGSDSILLTSSLGVQQAWVVPYAGVFDDEATGIAVDRVGNVYVTGFSSVPDYSAYITIKYNTRGQEEWTVAYADPNSINFARAIAVDNSGNVYVTGRSGTFDSGNDDYATIKYNSAGEEQWVARYNGAANDNDGATAIAVDNVGNVYVTGSSFGSGTDVDYATIKYDSSGQEQWVARYNGAGNGGDTAVAIVVDSLGNVYVTGGSLGIDGFTQYATIQYNAAGEERWVARYDGPGTGSDEARAIGLDSSGNIYVTGSSFGSGANSDYVTIKYNPAGQEQWIARYDGPGNLDDFATAIAVNSSGDVYVTGGSAGDYATIMYNSSGQEQWVARYNGPENFDDYASALALDRLGNVYVTGAIHQSDVYYDYDFATIKYTQPRLRPTPYPRPMPFGSGFESGIVHSPPTPTPRPRL